MVEQLWLEERPRLEDYLRANSLPAHAVQDVVDEAFARLLPLGERATPEMLWRKAFDAVRDYHRDIEKREVLLAQADILTGRAISSIEDAMFRADFMAGLKRLPEETRAAFYWTAVRGLTERETAEALGVSQQMINRRIEAARLFLRDWLLAGPVAAGAPSPGQPEEDTE
jgi:RNA polymerase sigma factor (sigma-70 family)